VRRQAIALSVLLFTTSAGAQISGSTALLSDYRYRGESLSDGRPAAQVSLAYDGEDGWYAGLLAASVRPDERTRAQVLAYLGIARPLRAGLSWEAGAEYAAIAGGSEYDYPQFYLGLVSERSSLRLHYARHYVGQHAAVLYAELDHSWPLGGPWHLLAHLGLLRRAGPAGDDGGRYRGDARLGLGLDWHGYDLQLAWTVVRGSRAPYPFGDPHDGQPARQAWVLSCSRSW
jgi:uncharacterized protein (TIGR02001 family)